MDQTGDRPRERSQDEMTGVMTDCAQEMAVQAHFSQHPTVVAVFDTAIECADPSLSSLTVHRGSKVYIAMQLAVGGDLCSSQPRRAAHARRPGLQRQRRQPPPCRRASHRYLDRRHSQRPRVHDPGRLCVAPSRLPDAADIHRDVKLENFLLDENGHALLSDFGYGPSSLTPHR